METEIIENTLKLKEKKIKDILTPRSVMFAVQKDTLIQDLLEDKRTYKFSRVPVYDNSIDNIVGVVLTKKIFKHAIKNPNVTIETIMSNVESINENIPVLKGLSSFTKAKGHLLIVTDSYDQTEGIVTLEDCLETLLGLEIMDELDTTEDMRKLASAIMKAKRKKKESELIQR
jgi:CBS domain containing-hemolysin-like protein